MRYPTIHPVDCRYGAPMGRSTWGIPEMCESHSIRLFQVPITDGYDPGGAYWGLGEPLWCATDDEGCYRAFTRATTRALACSNLDIHPLYLKTRRGI